MKKEKDFLQNGVSYRLTYILVGSVIYLPIKLLYLIFLTYRFLANLYLKLIFFFVFFFHATWGGALRDDAPGFSRKGRSHQRCAKYKMQLSINCYALSVNVKKK